MSFNHEWFVSGVWNAWLSNVFPSAPIFGGQPAYVTSPEVHAIRGNGNSNRADLVVTPVTYANGTYTIGLPILSFEAKGAGNDTWPGVRAQIQAWCQQSPELTNGGPGGASVPCFCIGARGRDVKFWIFSNRAAQAPGGQFMNPIDVINGVITPRKDRQSDQLIEMPFDHARVAQILNWMLNNWNNYANLPNAPW